MYRKYIQAVEPLDDFVLLIDFTSGSRLLLDMKPHLDSIRFRSLRRPEVWKSAETNGVFVRFGSVELSHDELMTMAEQGRAPLTGSRVRESGSPRPEAGDLPEKLALFRQRR